MVLQVSGTINKEHSKVQVIFLCFTRGFKLNKGVAVSIMYVFSLSNQFVMPE